MLTSYYCKDKIEELDAVVDRFEQSELDVYVDYIHHIKRLRDCYKSELAKSRFRHVPKGLSEFYDNNRSKGFRYIDGVKL